MAAALPKALALLSVVLQAVPAKAGEIRASVLDPKGKGVPDAIVFIQGSAPDGGKLDPPAEPYVLDQIKAEFVPHVLPVLLGSKVRFPNKDNTHHHVYSFSAAKRFELPLYKDQGAEPVEMSKAGVVKLGCNIHDGMLGYIVVLETSFFAKTDASGKAVIRDVPKGRYEVAVWSERLKGLPEATKLPLEVSETSGELIFNPKLSAPSKPVKKVY